MSIQVKKIDNVMVAKFLDVELNADVLVAPVKDLGPAFSWNPQAQSQSTGKTYSASSGTAPIATVTGPYSNVNNLSNAEKNVLNKLASTRRAMGRGDLMKSTGLNESSWNITIKSLKDSNLVRSIGNRRSAKYTLTDAAGRMEGAATVAAAEGKTIGVVVENSPKTTQAATEALAQAQKVLDELSGVGSNVDSDDDSDGNETTAEASGEADEADEADEFEGSEDYVEDSEESEGSTDSPMSSDDDSDDSDEAEDDDDDDDADGSEDEDEDSDEDSKSGKTLTTEVAKTTPAVVVDVSAKDSDKDVSTKDLTTSAIASLPSPASQPW